MERPQGKNCPGKKKKEIKIAELKNLEECTKNLETENPPQKNELIVKKATIFFANCEDDFLKLYGELIRLHERCFDQRQINELVDFLKQKAREKRIDFK